MRLYAESSAVLAWLLGEPSGVIIRAALEQTDLVMASDLTLVECERVLIRATALGELSESVAAARRSALNAATSRWHIAHLGQDVVERARRTFPIEPVRTLDALHLATALVMRAAVADLEMLTLDARIRNVASALGLPVQPLGDFRAPSAVGT